MAKRQRKIDFCCACGAFAPLSFEHVPPKHAFNDRGVLLSDLEHHFAQGVDRDPRKMRKRKSRKGMGRETLCERCNKGTGHLYGNAYIDWAMQGWRCATPCQTAPA